jgi:hypothetical protein
MSPQSCVMDVKNRRACRLNLIGHFSPIIPPFTNRGLSRHRTWSASGNDGENKSGAQRALPLRPRCIGVVGSESA